MTDDSWLLPKVHSETPPIPMAIITGLLGAISLGTAVLSVLFSESHSRHSLLKTMKKDNSNGDCLILFLKLT